MERVKRSFRMFLLALALVFTTSACFDITSSVEPSINDDIPIAVDFFFPDDTPRTKGIVPGTDNPISVMQLICFDASGLYLGIRTVDTTPDDYGECVRVTRDVDPTTKTQKGQLIARVPAATARVHFIANRNLETPLEFTAGTSERIVMSNLSTSYDETRSQGIVYWGYHAEKTAERFLAWMKVALVEDQNTHEISINGTPNKVYLIRDRARLQLAFGTNVLNGYSKVEWLVHNGRCAGLIAPFNMSQPENLTGANVVNPWTDYTDAAHTQATVPLTELTSADNLAQGKQDRYSLWTSAADENRTFDSSDTYQYLFDDSNREVKYNNTNIDGRVKIILKVYTDNTHFKYLVILVKNDNSQVEIVRNNTYVMTINSLEARGYSTLEAAVNGTEFANAPVESPKELTAVSNENFILQVALDETPETAENTTTSNVYSSTGDHIIPFKFLYASNSAVVDTVTAASFEVKWEEGTYGSWTWSQPDSLTFNNATQCWEVHVNMGQIGTSSPYSDYIVIKHKGSGLTRYVHLYGIQSFAFGAEPVFTKENTTYSETVNGTPKTYDVYKLTFTLPDTYGEDLYPINIRMATTTLEPYSDNLSSSRNGMFGVIIASTSNLTPNSTTATDWNYKATSWGYWYEYSLPSMPHLQEANQGEVVIYFLDTRSSKAQTNPSGVGLFLTIPYFGGLRYYHIP